MADCIYNLTKIYRPKKKSCQEKAKRTGSSFLVHEFFFVRLLVFEIYSILYSTFIEAAQAEVKPGRS